MMIVAPKIRIFTVLSILFVIGLFFSGRSFAWTKTATFETGTIGAIATGATAWDDAGTRTTFSTDITHNSSKSSKMAWVRGDEGFSSNRGNINNISVSDGGEIWVRGYFYFATPWSWTSYNGAYSVIKVLRGVTDSGGMPSIFSNSYGQIVLSNEPAGRQSDNQTMTYNAYTNMDIGRWMCLEMYVKVSSGSSGIIRIWKDGVLVVEDMGYKTIANSYNKITGIQVMSNWNNAPSQNQNQYLDNFVITTDQPSNFDNHGNPMIGPIERTNVVTAPIPPTGLHLISK